MDFVLWFRGRGLRLSDRCVWDNKNGCAAAFRFHRSSQPAGTAGSLDIKKQRRADMRKIRAASADLAASGTAASSPQFGKFEASEKKEHRCYSQLLLTDKSKTWAAHVQEPEGRSRVSLAKPVKSLFAGGERKKGNNKYKLLLAISQCSFFVFLSPSLINHLGMDSWTM